MEPIIKDALMTFVAGFAGATFSKAKGPGQALDDVMTIVGFDRLHEVAEKKRAKIDHNIQLYKDSIAQKIVVIPEDDLKDPPLAVVGPALEASKYYIEEETLREMFANLISSSMDKRKDTIIHSSFVEIIKQLTPLDAENLKTIFEAKTLPILGLDNYKENIRIQNVFLSNPNCQDPLLTSASLDNLARLGLVENTFMEWLERDAYNVFQSHSDFKFSKIDDDTERQGLTTMTSFGNNFCATCL